MKLDKLILKFLRKNKDLVLAFWRQVERKKEGRGGGLGGRVGREHRLNVALISSQKISSNYGKRLLSVYLGNGTQAYIIYFFSTLFWMHSLFHHNKGDQRMGIQTEQNSRWATQGWVLLGGWSDYIVLGETNLFLGRFSFTWRVNALQNFKE